MDDEWKAQRTTFLLQEIDANLNQAYCIGQKICLKLKDHNANLSKQREALAGWTTFFQSFLPPSSASLSSFSPLNTSGCSPKMPPLCTTPYLKSSRSSSAARSESSSKTPEMPLLLTTPYMKMSRGKDSVHNTTPRSSRRVLQSTPAHYYQPEKREDNSILYNSPRDHSNHTGENVKPEDEYEEHHDYCPTPEMPSLKATKLRAVMTPRTPLSHTRSLNEHENKNWTEVEKMKDLDDNEDEEYLPPPVFALDLFPSVFQTGTGATQIQTMYARFEQEQKEKGSSALNLNQLQLLLPQFGAGRMELLLETLVSRRLLRPFAVEGELYWELQR